MQDVGGKRHQESGFRNEVDVASRQKEPQHAAVELACRRHGARRVQEHHERDGSMGGAFPFRVVAAIAMRAIEAARRVPKKPGSLARGHLYAKPCDHAVAATLEPGFDFADEIGRRVDHGRRSNVRFRVDPGVQNLRQFRVSSIHTPPDRKTLGG